MENFMSFAEYLGQRDEARGSFVPSPTGDGDAPDLPMVPGDPDPVSERSMFRGVFKAVKPARPASPTNSRLLASPSRKRLGSQVIGNNGGGVNGAS
jgi:hypothetical protein